MSKVQQEAGVLSYSNLADRDRRGKLFARAAIWLALVMPISFISGIVFLLIAIRRDGLWGPDPAWVDWVGYGFIGAAYCGPITGLAAALAAFFFTRRFRAAIVLGLFLNLLEIGVVIWSRWT